MRRVSTWLAPGTQRTGHGTHPGSAQLASKIDKLSQVQVICSMLATPHCSTAGSITFFKFHFIFIFFWIFFYLFFQFLIFFSNLLINSLLFFQIWNHFYCHICPNVWVSNMVSCRKDSSEIWQTAHHTQNFVCLLLKYYFCSFVEEIWNIGKKVLHCDKRARVHITIWKDSFKSFFSDK